MREGVCVEEILYMYKLPLSTPPFCPTVFALAHFITQTYIQKSCSCSAARTFYRPFPPPPRRLPLLLLLLCLRICLAAVLALPVRLLRSVNSLTRLLFFVLCLFPFFLFLFVCPSFFRAIHWLALIQSFSKFITWDFIQLCSFAPFSYSRIWPFIHLDHLPLLLVSTRVHLLFTIVLSPSFRATYNLWSLKVDAFPMLFVLHPCFVLSRVCHLPSVDLSLFSIFPRKASGRQEFIFASFALYM